MKFRSFLLKRVSAILRNRFVFVLLLFPGFASAQTYEGNKSSWCGFDRYDFSFQQLPCTVVAPKKAAKGKPWIWNAMFFGHKTNVDSALLAKGFHVVYIGAVDLFGSPKAVAIWDKYYQHLIANYKLNKKPALEGLSRGGLYVFNWAAANPAKVSCIYADAPVCDFKSWPGGYGIGKGDTTEWKKCMKAYEFKTALEAFNYRSDPIDNLATLRQHKIPILFVTGDADDIVPAEENCLVMEQKYKAMGGKVQVIVKPGIDHKHGLADAAPITGFILKHTRHD